MVGVGTRRLVEETEAHVVVRLLLLLGLLLSGGVLSGGTTGGSTTSSGGGGGTRAGTDVQEELLDILALKSLWDTRQVRQSSPIRVLRFVLFPSLGSAFDMGFFIEEFARSVIVPWRRGKSRWAQPRAWQQR
jgi:hypothetical protein